MKAEQIVNAMNDIDDKYIEEAVNYSGSAVNESGRTAEPEKKDDKKPAGSRAMRIWRIVAIAACVCLAASLTFTILSMNGGEYSYSAKSRTSADGYYNEEMAAEEDYAVYESDADYEMTAYDDSYAVSENDGETGTWSGTTGTDQTASADQSGSSKIIYTVYMEMQTKEFDSALTGIDEVTSQYGGYCESQYLSNGTSGYRSASYTIRVPAENLDAFLNQMGNICTVTYVSRSAEDVSEDYYDIESRLTTAKTKLARLQELLSEAENMEDIITIEEAISDTEWEIDSYSGFLRSYDSQIEYSTVTLSLSEVYEVTIDDAPMSFGEKISQSFGQGLKGFGTFMQNAAVWFAGSWLWLVIAAVIVAAVIIIIRRHIDKKKK